MTEARLKELRNYYEKLIEHKLDTQKEYQKIIMGLSGGALTISMTFSDNIVSSQGTFFNFILIIGWGLLFLTILLQVYYNRLVTSSTSNLILKLEEVLSEKGEDNDEIFDIYLIKIRELEFVNKISTLMMCFGLLSISIFFSLNFLSKNKNFESSTNRKDVNTINKSSNNIPPISIENNPIFINNNGKIDTTIIKKIIYRKPKPKKPCQQ
ncbi:hypothetical protein BD847_0238 [Flavobacterium cutihirudinis]|uniref:Uncharacterized protein n=1 Tax=Flavobacterium cutihirudinis TaxID=1265740 RepID=A0A3D9FZB6_9FLAO|nr:hypothetical protein [Flavobacterium cutihirudinis]RED26321.1 hypothetical protein BD847_0238 [Flavobacterium cutihirudinis]